MAAIDQSVGIGQAAPPWSARYNIAGRTMEDGGRKII
jgi:hypothetical protein